MYRENNDIRTPRDRVSENDLARYLLLGELERTERNEARSDCGCEGEQNERGGRNDLNCRGERRPREDGRSCSAYTVPLGFPLAAVYVPRQAWRSLYECSEALSHGTLFVELDKPLEVARGRKCR